MSNLSAESVWKHLGQMYGVRWVESFGKQPNDEWKKAIGELRSDQVRGALSKLRNTPAPYDGWLPDLTAFLVRARAISPLPKRPVEAQQTTWQNLVDQLFLVWLWKEAKSGRRQIFGKEPRSIPDPELHERRRVCRQLAKDFELMECEGDPSANRDWLRSAFDAQMRLIPVSNPL